MQVALSVQREGEALSPPVTLIAMVDSGAFTSALPIQVARDLGITDDELEQDPDGGFGVGSHFSFSRPTVPVIGGVARLTLEGTSVPWADGFVMAPVFTEHNSFLLGRQDFFKAFTVTFEEGNADGPFFHLDAPDPPSVTAP